MNEARPTLAVSGFGLRITPLAERTFRFDANDVVASDVATVASRLADVARVEAGPSTSAWWIEAPTYRIPLPASWTLHASGEPTSAPPFELIGPHDASISVRNPRRMPSIEAFQGPDHVFRDVGQLKRAGWIEFEQSDGARAWLYRHEQLHRGTSPFIVTLKADVDRASEHMAVLAEIVEQLELRDSP